MAFLIDKRGVALKHNQIPGAVPFHKLSPFLQQKCFEFHLNGGQINGTSALKEHKIFMPGKRLSATKKLLGKMALLREGSWDDDGAEAGIPHDPDVEPAETPVDRTKDARVAATELSKSPTLEFDSIDDLAKHLQARVKAGDEEAWRQLERAFFPYVKALALQNLYYYPELADEMAQDSLLEMHKKIAQWEDGTGLMTWLKYIVRGKCYNAEDKEKNHNPLSKVAVDDTPQSENEEGDVHFATAVAQDDTLPPDKAVERDDEVNHFMDAIHRMLNSLPEEEARVMLMYAFEEIPQQEIAEKLGWKLSKVKARLENARFYAKRWLESNPEMGKVMSFIRNESKESSKRGFISNFQKFVETCIILTEGERAEVASDDPLSSIDSFLNESV
jgi:RNA polymerase sigma-70 factor (ECF subfamily)